jgi:tRNA A58 N-methylase Trm61
MAMAMARAVGPSGRVICLELIPKNIENLRQNILANSLACLLPSRPVLVVTYVDAGRWSRPVKYM